ncbi:DUF4041 domain-containing protein [Tenacibaculum piscium]|uniref:DUF4041 domain-containing protein n=1 Tax=Tenacibaculum piscium TaxID=1458515 RepID=UPI001F21E1B0|nr:DUF4041 domain-containing protein [Tenacibaculum piscium]
MDIFNIKTIKLLENKLERYSKITDVENEIKQLQEKFEADCKNQIEKLNIRDKEIQLKKNKLHFREEIFNNNYKQATLKFSKLKKEIDFYQTDLDAISVGIQKPIYKFDTAEQYKEELVKIRNQQKIAIKNNSATNYEIPVLFGKKTATNIEKAKKSAELQAKLMLKAFNEECNTLISKVKWNTIESVKKRIEKAFLTTNKLGKSNHIAIQNSFLHLRIKELNLVGAYQNKKQAEKEKELEVKKQIREENKLLRDIENSKKKIEKQEIVFQKQLEKANKEISTASGKNKKQLTDKIKKITHDLNTVIADKQKAFAMEKNATAGHVYIISNVGSFGKNIYKIGMTRRLEPLEQINELQTDALPFQFDVNAIIFSNNAPELEKKILQELKDKNINPVNFKKNFFKVSIKELEKIIKNNFTEDFTLIKTPKATEYRIAKNILSNKKPIIKDCLVLKK